MELLDFVNAQSIGTSALQAYAVIAEGAPKFMYIAVGAATFCAGLLMLSANRRDVDDAFAGDGSPAYKRIELRKYRRRATTSAMISILGCFIGGCYWVTEKRLAAVFLLIIMVLLTAIAVLACVDMFSVGFRHIVSGNRDNQKAILEELVRRHKESSNDDESKSR